MDADKAGAEGSLVIADLFLKAGRWKDGVSKGPGKWQRLILSELAIRDRFNLLELLGPTFTKAQYNALHWAMLEWGTFSAPMSKPRTIP
ncbi:MAG: hypothetical protein ABSB94_18910 [Syntrophorhabdales bacterium]|jgi:hypothetical protein